MSDSAILGAVYIIVVMVLLGVVFHSANNPKVKEAHGIFLIIGSFGWPVAGPLFILGYLGYWLAGKAK